MENLSNVSEVTESLELVDATSAISSELASTILANLDKLANSKGAVKLGAEYHEFKVEGETVSGVYAGMVKAKFKVQDFDAKNPQYNIQDAVKWVMKTKDKVETKICASVALVNRVKEHNIPLGAGVNFTYTGKDGNVKLFDVSIIAL